MRKLIGIIISIAMIMGLFTSLSVTTLAEEGIVPEYEFTVPASGQKELLNNAGFEDKKSSGSGLVSWSGVWNQDTGTGVKIIEKVTDPEHVRTGERSIKITTDQTDTRRNATQWVSLVPGAKYQASVWVNVAAIGSAKIRFAMAYWDKAHKKNPGGYVSSWVQYADKKNEWKQFVMHFDALDLGDNEVEFRIDLFDGDGEVYFDDASLYMIAPPTKMKFSTSEALYYTELKNGLATAALNIKQYPELAGSTVDFRVKDGNAVIEEKLNASTQGDNIARYCFDLTTLQIQKEYTVEAVLKDKYGAELETQAETVQRFLPRPTALSEEGFFIKDGEPVNVMLAYTRPEPLNDAASLNPLVDQGVTAFMQGSRADITDDIVGRALDHAQLKGLMAVVGLYPNMKPAGHPDNVDNTTYYVTKYKNHPALLGWAVLDEPSGYYKGAELDKLMKDSYKLIRGIDPVHPVYAVEATTEFLPLISRYVDILASDPYPWSSKPIAGTPATYIRAATEAAEYVKPTLSLVQICELQGYFPTVMESRHQWYQSLFEGANMLGYYSYRLARPGQTLSQTDIWPGLVEFGQGEQNDAFDSFVYRKYPIFSESNIIGANVWWSSYIKDGSLYMTVLNMDEVNRNAEAQTVDIPLKSDGGAVVINGFTADLANGEGVAHIEGSGSTLSLPLEQNAAVVYKITPNTQTDFSALKTTKFRDLGRYSWAAEQIRELESRGIVEGLTAIAYRPEYKITRGDFAMNLIRTLGLTSDSTENFSDVIEASRYAKEVAVGKALGILQGGGDGRFYPESEISRQDMIALCARGICASEAFRSADLVRLPTLDQNRLSDYVIADISALLRSEFGKKNIDVTISDVTRAEAAIVLHRLMQWADNPLDVYAAAKRLYTVDGDTVSKLLLTEEGWVSDNGLWYNVLNYDGCTYVAVNNYAAARTFSVQVTGEAVQLIYGNSEITYSGGTLSADMSEDNTVILRVYGSAPFGLYEGNILLSSLGKGTYILKNAGGQGFIALYGVTGGVKKLLRIEQNELQFQPVKGKEYVVSAFDWLDIKNLEPQKEQYTLSGVG